MCPYRWPVFVAFIAAVAVLTASPSSRSDQPSKAKDELKLLQGTWMLHAYVVDGRTLRGEDALCTLTVEDDHWTCTWRKDGGGEQVEQGVVKIIDTTGKPKVMDFVHVFGPHKGTTTRAFYQADGNSLRYSTVVAPASLEDAKVITATMTWKRKLR